MELQMVYTEDRVKELNFKYSHVVAVPPTICPYCHGMGYSETGEDTSECRPCKGTGRKKQ